MSDLPVLSSERLMLRILDENEAGLISKYYKENRYFHQPWFSARTDEVFTDRQQKKNLQAELRDFNTGRALPFWLSLKNTPDKIIGRFALTNIIHGSFRSAIASWHLDRNFTGQGYALEAGRAAITAAFRDYRLHRIEANILPDNKNSIRLAENLGFEFAGYENRYLEINDEWADHLHFVKLADGPYNHISILPEISGDQVMLRALDYSDIPTLVSYFTCNQAHLEAFNPAMPEILKSELYWYKHLLQARIDLESGRLINLGVFLKDRPERIIGCIEIRDIIQAPYSCCELGFSLDSRLTGQGLMLESLNLLLGWLFSHLNINRVNARYIPGNTRSEKILQMLGFCREGLQRQAFVKNNKTEDLILCSLLAEDFRWIE